MLFLISLKTLNVVCFLHRRCRFDRWWIVFDRIDFIDIVVRIYKIVLFFRCNSYWNWRQESFFFFLKMRFLTHENSSLKSLIFQHILFCVQEIHIMWVSLHFFACFVSFISRVRRLQCQTNGDDIVIWIVVYTHFIFFAQN